MTAVRRWLLSRAGLFTAAALALILGCGAFAYSLAQVNHLAAQNRAIAERVAQETRGHCLADAAAENRRRALDLALIRADRATLARLRVLPFAGAGDHAMHLVLIAYYSAALAARLADIPAYTNPRSCRVAGA